MTPTRPRIPTPPRHLGPAGKALYRSLQSEYGIEDAGGLAILAQAADCADRLESARKAIQEHGELVADRYGKPRLNPALVLEKDARAQFLQGRQDARFGRRAGQRKEGAPPMSRPRRTRRLPVPAQPDLTALVVPFSAIFDTDPRRWGTWTPEKRAAIGRIERELHELATGGVFDPRRILELDPAAGTAWLAGRLAWAAEVLRDDPRVDVDR
jgi:hypothetical protein